MAEALTPGGTPLSPVGFPVQAGNIPWVTPCLVRIGFTSNASRSYQGSIAKLGKALFGQKQVTGMVFSCASEVLRALTTE